MTTALVLTALAVAIFGIVFVTILAQATDEHSGAQHAADAAALGGAGAYTLDIESQLDDGFADVAELKELVGSPSGICLPNMEAGAQRLAFKNQAAVTQCSWDGVRGELAVSVRLDETNTSVAQGQRAEASATSSVGLDIDECYLDPGFELPTPTSTPTTGPSPTTSPTPSPSPTSSEPPVDISTEIHCGDTTLEVAFSGEDELFHLESLEQLEDLLEPTLVE